MHRFHRFVFPCLSAAIALACAAASRSETKSPPALGAALEDWIVLLEKDDLKAARDRWAAGAEAADALTEHWPQLKQCHKAHDYRAWLDKRPGTEGGASADRVGDATRFTVGGHDYGHLHVTWQKTDKGWRVGKVWMCR